MYQRGPQKVDIWALQKVRSLGEPDIAGKGPTPAIPSATTTDSNKHNAPLQWSVSPDY